MIGHRCSRVRGSGFGVQSGYRDDVEVSEAATPATH
jgi:hypothetical protein